MRLGAKQNQVGVLAEAWVPLKGDGSRQWLFALFMVESWVSSTDTATTPRLHLTTSRGPRPGDAGWV